MKIFISVIPSFLLLKSICYSEGLFDKNKIFLKILIFSFMLIMFGCTSSDSGSSGSSGSTTSSTDTCTTTTSSTVNTPDNFETILNQSVTLDNITSKSGSVSGLDRILIKYDSSYLSLDNSSYAIGLDSSISTYNDVFLKSFQAIEQSSDSCFRLDSEKHSNYSIDYNSSTMRLQMRDTFGYSRDSDSAYLCFTFSGTNMTATKRFSFNTTNDNYTEDTTFSSKYVYYDTTNSYFILSSSSSSITPYDSGIDFAIPTSFNPTGATMVSNSRVPWTTSGTDKFSDHSFYGEKVWKDTYTTYKDQVLTVGDDKCTSVSAANMLTQIKSDLESGGDSLRYDTSVYIAFRNTLLKTKLTGETIVGGTVGLNTAPYVFFTNETDDSGVRHPFMVIASYSISDRPNRLLDVKVPPGDGTTSSYATQKVTRDATLGTFLYKIPLKDYGEVSSVTENTMGDTLAQDNATPSTTYNNYTWTSISTLGIAIDGVQIYPVFNNVLMPAAEKAEITNTGIHVGRGMGLHWHADGHGATGNGLNLYNISDYEGNNHPPLIGFGLDGIALYGKYESSFSSMDGYSTTIDSFGGHEHGNYNYHYHAHEIPSSEIGSSYTYTIHALMKGAWKGAINNIPEFWNGTVPAASYAQTTKYVGNNNAF